MANETFIVEVTFVDQAREIEEYIVDRSGLEAINQAIMGDGAFISIPTVYGLIVWLNKDSVEEVNAQLDESQNEDTISQGEGSSAPAVGSQTAA